MTFHSLWWAVPFIGLILSMAILPLLAPRLWQRHYGKIAAMWSGGLLVSLFFVSSGQETLAFTAEALLHHYQPFLVLVFSLYIIASGIRIEISHVATPAMNTLLLGCGVLLANIVGTTGAAMILVRPLLSMNQERNMRRHLMIFFIILVANVGGCLTPIGDPPLFLGFIRGVDFFWTTRHLFLPLTMVAVPLLVIFYFFDRYCFSQEERLRAAPFKGEKFKVSLEGGYNFLWLMSAIAFIISAGIWHDSPSLSVLGLHVKTADLIRDAGLLGCAGLSWYLTPKLVRVENNFHWHPVVEVAKLFAGIFITVTPLLLMLQLGKDGPFAFLHLWLCPGELPDAMKFFWVTGALSAFLDNAPTYLVFFNALDGGNPATLMTTYAKGLTAISAGAVFMGAVTYIGNAPNFMVKSIAEDEGVKMPNFFAYMGWACVLLLPVLFLMNFMLFR